MAALPLQRIEGKYEILEKIREGGMGAIYKVRHRLLDEIRVIKLMRQQLVEDEELKARFLREARLAIKLRHPNIAQLYDFTVDDDGTAFIVMEFIDGMTLEDVLSFHGPPPLGLALEIAQQSLRAIAYLHLKGLIHRDISPDNLMLTVDTDGQPLVKLIDLGIAKIQGTGGESHLTQTGTFLGKIRYAPPEQFGADGASMVDSRGDLYSFGVVLYELLTARFPIQGKDPSSLIAGHLFRPPLDFAETDPGGRLSADLRAVVLKALAKSPDERFATATELARALGGFRTPSDVPEEALQELLARPFIRAGASSIADAGSTQDRLDQNFELASTPSPGSLLHLAKTATPTPVSMKPGVSQAVRETAGTIEAQLEKGDLVAAEAELRWAVDTFGERPELRTLRDRLQEMKVREAELLQARELAAALAEIEAALEKKDYRTAESLLYGAETRFGEREELSPFYERIAGQRSQELAEKKRREEIAGRIAAARELAGREDFQGALEELSRATLLDPDDAEVSALIQEIEASARRKEEEDRAARVQALVAEARQLAATERLDEALATLRQAADLAPDHSMVRNLTQEVRTALRWREEEKRRTAELASAAAALEVHLGRGELTRAADLLEKTVAAHGDHGPLPELRTRLQTLRARTIEQPAEPERAAPVPEPPEAEAPRAVPPLPRPEPPPQVLTEPVAPPAPAHATNWKRWAAVAAGVLLLVVAALFLTRREEAPAPPEAKAPSPAPAVSVPPVLQSAGIAAAPGTLVLDAVPWGEVVEVVDDHGKQQALGPQKYTPLVLSLPPGRYTVTLRNPGFPKPVSLTADILAGVQARSVGEFGTVSEEEFFRRMGW